MTRKTPLTLISILLLVVLFGGCSAGQATPTASVQGMVQTSVAQTVQVVSTQLVAQQQPTITSAPMVTLAPSDTPPAQSNNAPTSAPQPVQASNGSSPNCDNVAFLGDVTIPDDDIIPPGTTFKKSWFLKNNGTCTAWAKCIGFSNDEGA